MKWFMFLVLAGCDHALVADLPDLTHEQIDIARSDSADLAPACATDCVTASTCCCIDVSKAKNCFTLAGEGDCMEGYCRGN